MDQQKLIDESITLDVQQPKLNKLYLVCSINSRDPFTDPENIQIDFITQKSEILMALKIPKMFAYIGLTGTKAVQNKQHEEQPNQLLWCFRLLDVDTLIIITFLIILNIQQKLYKRQIKTIIKIFIMILQHYCRLYGWQNSVKADIDTTNNKGIQQIKFRTNNQEKAHKNPYFSKIFCYFIFRGCCLYLQLYVQKQIFILYKIQIFSKILIIRNYNYLIQLYHQEHIMFKFQNEYEKFIRLSFQYHKKLVSQKTLKKFEIEPTFHYHFLNYGEFSNFQFCYTQIND